MQDASQKLLQGPAANLKGLNLAKAIDAVYQDMPMNPDQVADWVNAYFPPDVAAIGHVRFKELLARDLRQVVVGGGVFRVEGQGLLKAARCISKKRFAGGATGARVGST